MSFKDGTMRFVPDDKIINADNNDTVIECDFIELYEPRSINKGAYRSLKQHISSALLVSLPRMRKLSEIAAPQDKLLEVNKEEEKPTALINLTEEQHGKKTSELTDMMILALEAGSENGVLHLFAEAFKKVLIQYDSKPLAKLNGDTPITSRIWESMSAEDQERMAVGYCSFFGIGSLGKMMKGSESASEQPTEVKAL